MSGNWNLALNPDSQIRPDPDFLALSLTSFRGKHPYFCDNFFESQAIWLGSHPEASGHGSSKRRASRGISGFSGRKLTKPSERFIF
jgi:hypothetical protein